MRVLPRLAGAFCLVFCDENTLYAARDPHGVRPLVLGRLEHGPKRVGDHGQQRR